jgi:hypothetical protein
MKKYKGELTSDLAIINDPEFPAHLQELADKLERMQMELNENLKAVKYLESVLRRVKLMEN